MNTIICGLQWGDEGKGKIIDYLTEHADLVIRGQGGNNAGHTVKANGETYILHLVPSGILWPNKTCIIGNGVVIDLIGLLKEIEELESQGVAINPEKLLISDRAHVVLPYHRELDAANEAALGDKKIGTTKRGIGPCYADKANRWGLRLADLLEPKLAKSLIQQRLDAINPSLQHVGLETFTAPQVLDLIDPAMQRLRSHITNPISLLHQAWHEQKNILFEGAQGSLLDIDFGTYPYVTSSNTCAAGACTGSGLPPTAIDRVIGVCKAYTTRVGEGPMPTENQQLSDFFHERGMEFGATTGRPRRCGWLDTVLLRHAVMVNGVTDLAVTIIDGLDQAPTIKICVAYDIDGTRHELPPASRQAWQRAKPIYETLPGWQCSTIDCTSFEDLPPAAHTYLNRLSELIGAPVSFVGNGPNREQTLIK